MSSRLSFLVTAFCLLAATTACTALQPQQTPQELLVGEWMAGDGRHVIRFTGDGTWAMDDAGLLDTTPLVMGSYTFDGETAVLIMSEDGRACRAGDRWVWTVSSLDEFSLAGQAVEDECLPSAEGDEITIVRCDPGQEHAELACAPLDRDAFCAIAWDGVDCS